MSAPLNLFWQTKLKNGHFVPCSVLHPYTCELNALRRFAIVFKLAARFFLLYYFVLDVLPKRAELRENGKNVIRGYLKKTLDSVLFFAFYISSFWYGLCFFKNLRGKIDKWNTILAAFCCSFACLFENPVRRNELALFTFTRFVESFYYYLVEKKLMFIIPNGDKLVFAIALGILMSYYQGRDRNIKVGMLK